MSQIGQRLKVLVPGIMGGAVCLALDAVAGFPSGWPVGDRIEAWSAMMTGPILAITFDASSAPTAVKVATMLGWLSVPLLFAHPLWPGKLTASLTLVALFWWFVAGWLNMVRSIWGA
jgi:hypothetical protein